MTNMNVIPVSQDSYIVNGCKVKITYAEDGDSMEVLQKLIHEYPLRRSQEVQLNRHPCNKDSPALK